MKADIFRSPRYLAVVAVVIAVAAAGVVASWNRNHDATAPSDDGITVVPVSVSVRGDAPRRPMAPDGRPGKPLAAMLDTSAADRLVTQYLPALGQVRSSCDADVCSISAIPSAAGASLEDPAFSQLVREDMPTILARSGHPLTEPVQIEEIGANQYRLQFRISRQAR